MYKPKKFKQMKKLILCFVAFLGIATMALAEETTDKYALNEQEIALSFQNAEQVNTLDLSMESMSNAFATNNSAMMGKSSVNPWGAFAICTFVGELGIHRLYMGAPSKMIAYYCLTCGGIFGVVTLVDWVVLLIGAINDNITPYMNDQFFMWM